MTSLKWLVIGKVGTSIDLSQLKIGPPIPALLNVRELETRYLRHLEGKILGDEDQAIDFTMVDEITHLWNAARDGVKVAVSFGGNRFLTPRVVKVMDSFLDNNKDVLTALNEMKGMRTLR